jgi:hypothetical protein
MGNPFAGLFRKTNLASHEVDLGNLVPALTLTHNGIDFSVSNDHWVTFARQRSERRGGVVGNDIAGSSFE